MEACEPVRWRRQLIRKDANGSRPPRLDPVRASGCSPAVAPLEFRVSGRQLTKCSAGRNAFRQPRVVGSPRMVLPAVRTMFDDRRARGQPGAVPVDIDARRKTPVRHRAAEHQHSHGSPYRDHGEATHMKTFCSGLSPDAPAVPAPSRMTLPSESRTGQREGTSTERHNAPTRRRAAGIRSRPSAGTHHIAAC